MQITDDGPGTQNLTGWHLDCVLPPRTYSFPSGYSLAAGAYARVHSGPSALNSPPTHLLWTTDYVWNDSGRAQLYNAADQVVSQWRY